MVVIDAKMVADLRAQTGAPIKDCKAALTEAKGDSKLAVEVLRKKGIKAAEGLAGRTAAEGLLFSYVHHNGRIGVLAEVVCETDFVARNDEFKQFGKQLCMHITAAYPRFLDRSQIAPELLEKEREIATEQTRVSMPGKPAEVVAKAVEGRLAKFYAESCLLDQPWTFDSAISVDAAVKQLAGKIGENIQIRRFVRMELGG